MGKRIRESDPEPKRTKLDPNLDDGKKRVKKKKKVHFAEDVMEPTGNGEEFRKRLENAESESFARKDTPKALEGRGNHYRTLVIGGPAIWLAMAIFGLRRNGSLWEFPHGGHLFTRINRSGSKLDRFLITENTTPLLSNYSALVLDCHISDHRPIVLSAATVDFGPSPFKLYNSWLLDNQLCTIISDFWIQDEADYGSNPIEKEKLLNKIKEFDEATTRNSGNILINSQRSDWVGKLHNIEREEHLNISQQAKVRWGIEADENTKFFHFIVNQKRRNLSLHGIKHDGSWLTDPIQIKDVFHYVFETKFKKKDVDRIVVRSHHYSSLQEDQNFFLISHISETEIHAAICDCGSEKLPGPDGFTFAFYKKFWDLVKSDVIAFVQDFLNTSTMPKGCNSSFIALIPKISNPMVVSDFRPISLIGAQYKIIAKVLANRLAKVIDVVISCEQTAFVKHRQILDVPLMVMHFMGFNEKWISWIKGCLSHATASILVNGSPTRLHVAIEDAICAGLYRGLTIKTLTLSHFFFADDALLIGCNATHSSFKYLGLPVDCNMAISKSWDPLIEKFSKRLSKWKESLLSIGGRTTLLTLVLGSIGTYYCSLFPMPASKDKGGLGIGSLFSLNHALIQKWRWRFFQNHNALWVQVIKAIHGDYGTDFSFNSHVREHGVWGRIVNSINSMHEKEFIPLSFLRKKVGDGLSTKFSHDVWIGDSSLQSKFSRLYRIASNKDCTVRDIWNNGWDFSWSRLILGGTILHQLNTFSSTLEVVTLSDSKDIWTWSIGSPSFSVKCTREHIDKRYLPDGDSKTRWN
nr:RNA-directed DNA polymerase, eukaryota, reverse transcriptase zinc-binding domain protein [Tanacetum cinerariifolium]